MDIYVTHSDAMIDRAILIEGVELPEGESEDDLRAHCQREAEHEPMLWAKDRCQKVADDVATHCIHWRIKAKRVVVRWDGKTRYADVPAPKPQVWYESGRRFGPTHAEMETAYWNEQQKRNW